MNQKGGLPLFILLTLPVVIFLSITIFYFYNHSSNNILTYTNSSASPIPTKIAQSQTPSPLIKTDKFSPSPTSTPSLPQKFIHPYPYFGTDQTLSINKIHIIGILFRPKDIDTEIKPEWLSNMDLIFKQIKTFYENQFQNNITITYEIQTDPVIGDKNIADYWPSDLATEVDAKKKSLFKNDSYNIYMIYLVRDTELKKNLQGGSLGGLAAFHAATQYEFWLNNEAITGKDPYGVVGSAHEFGHSLGIPHPWDLPANVKKELNWGNVPGDLMGYSNSNMQLNQLYIRDDVKKTMGL